MSRFTIEVALENVVSLDLELGNAAINMVGEFYELVLTSAVLDTRPFSISTDANNQAVFGLDGGLFVPPPQLSSTQW